MLTKERHWNVSLPPTAKALVCRFSCFVFSRAGDEMGSANSNKENKTGICEWDTGNAEKKKKRKTENSK